MSRTALACGLILVASGASPDDLPLARPEGGWLVVRVDDLARDPDGNKDEPGMIVVDPDTGRWRKIGGPEMWSARLSPDGSRILYMSRVKTSEGVWLRDFEGKEPGRRLYESPQRAFFVDNGRKVLVFDRFENGPPEVWTIDPDGPDRTRVELAGPLQVRAVSRDGRRLLAYGVGGARRVDQFAILDRQGRVLRVTDRGPHASPIVPSPSFSPDGGKFALTLVGLDGRPSLKVFETETGKTEAFPVDVKGVPSDTHWSPDGRRFAIYSSGNGGSWITIVDRDGTNAREIQLPFTKARPCGWD